MLAYKGGQCWCWDSIGHTIYKLYSLACVGVKTTIAGAIPHPTQYPQIFATIVKIEKQKIHVCGSWSMKEERGGNLKGARSGSSCWGDGMVRWKEREREKWKLKMVAYRFKSQEQMARKLRFENYSTVLSATEIDCKSVAHILDACLSFFYGGRTQMCAGIRILRSTVAPVAKYARTSKADMWKPCNRSIASLYLWRW